MWASWWPGLVVHGSRSVLSGPQGSLFRGYELSRLFVQSGYEQQRGRGRLDGQQKAGYVVREMELKSIHHKPHPDMKLFAHPHTYIYVHSHARIFYVCRCIATPPCSLRQCAPFTDAALGHLQKLWRALLFKAQNIEGDQVGRITLSIPPP